MVHAALKKTLAAVLRRYGTHHNRWAGLAFDWLDGGVYQAGGCSFGVPPELTTRAFRARFFFDVYEPEEVALVQQYVRSDDTVLEVGGGLGVVACTTNVQLASPERHVVLEAHPALVPWLRRNRDRNENRFDIVHGLLSNTSDGTFFVHPLIVGGSAVRTTSQEIQVPVHSYGELESRCGVPFSTIILDIEGGEKDFLEEHLEVLASVRCVIIEFHAHVGILTEEEAEAGRTRLREAGLSLSESRNHVEVWTRPDS